MTSRAAPAVWDRMPLLAATRWTRPDPANTSLINEQAIRLSDVENECAHGHLPGDPVVACECWTPDVTAGLAAQEPTLPDFSDDHMEVKVAVTEIATAVQAKAQPKLKPPKPFLLKLMGDIEDEIARLEEAHARLKEID